mgnify:FL=1
MFAFIKKLFLAPKLEEVLKDIPPEVQYIPVPKWTHPGKFGKDVYCPECKQTEHVYDFKWVKMTCTGCGTKTAKYEWLLKV